MNKYYSYPSLFQLFGISIPTQNASFGTMFQTCDQVKSLPFPHRFDETPVSAIHKAHDWALQCIAGSPLYDDEVVSGTVSNMTASAFLAICHIFASPARTPTPVVRELVEQLRCCDRFDFTTTVPDDIIDAAFMTYHNIMCMDQVTIDEVCAAESFEVIEAFIAIVDLLAG